MPAFLKDEKNLWVSTPKASGPFKGLQGGALAGLMVSEVEWLAEKDGLGLAISASVEFLRPTGRGALRSCPELMRKGRRASVFTNCLYEDEDLKAKATVCVVNPIEIPEIAAPAAEAHDIDALPPLPSRVAPHGGPWMMDNFETRLSPDGIVWFRYVDEIVEGAGQLAQVLGPADWTHGIARPASPKLADPNLNLQVSVFRHPTGVDIGIAPQTTWMPTGIGFGEGVLHDRCGPFGRVMMSVALTSFG